MEFLSEEGLQSLGKKIADLIFPPLVLTFSGDLGAGKTTLIRAILQSLGVEGAIKSPTFSLVESYQVGRVDYVHFDLYRLIDTSALVDIGFRDFFKNNAVCFIEWPERVENSALRCDLAFTLLHAQEQRALDMQAYTDVGTRLMEDILC